jgi:aconitate hydratase
VLIAAITSCTNTSNPSVMLAAGLLAKKAVEAGLKVAPHIKTSLAPGSRIVTDYLTRTGLLPYLEKLGFNVAAYGCTTCIGNAGDLAAPINEAITSNDLVACAVLSGNRNFEARIHPLIKANFLASPPLVVAYAIAGNVRKDLMTEPVGQGKKGKDVYLGDIWPSSERSTSCCATPCGQDLPRELRAGGRQAGQALGADPGQHRRGLPWPTSGYIARPPFFDGFEQTPTRVKPRCRAPASWRCSATPSPPTTSRRPARSSPIPRPAVTCRHWASSRWTSTATARAAATTR